MIDTAQEVRPRPPEVAEPRPSEIVPAAAHGIGVSRKRIVIVGGAPYGATTIAGGKGERQPSKLELDGARHQGELIAKTAAKLVA